VFCSRFVCADCAVVTEGGIGDSKLENWERKVGSFGLDDGKGWAEEHGLKPVLPGELHDFVGEGFVVWGFRVGIEGGGRGRLGGKVAGGAG